MSRTRMSILIVAGLLLVGALAALTLTGCATGPKIVNAWQDPDFKGLPFDDVLVMGVTANAGRQRIFESAFATRMEQQGIRARPSYEILPAGDKIPQEELEASIKEHQIDAVIVTRVLGVDRKSTYTPGYTIATPGSRYYRDYYGLYDYSYSYYHSPGHVSTYDVVQLETNVYDVATGTLVWTGMTETVDPGDIENESSKLADIIMSELTVRGLVAK